MKNTIEKLIATAKKEPVRTATGAVAAVLIVVSILTGQSVEVLIGEVAGMTALMEKVRSIVSPVVSLVQGQAEAPADPGATS